MADDKKEITLNFIEDYRSFPQLWEQTNKLYTNKVKRSDGLQVLAAKYNMNVDGVKKKIKSLRSYFSKEHQKVLKENSGAGSDEIYHSPWFAYNHLLFIADSVTPRETIETSTEEVKYSQDESFNEASSVTSQSAGMSEDEHDFTQPPIRKKIYIKSTKLDDKEEYNSFKKKNSEESTQKDEYSIYGELIAHKIRNLNSLNRLFAQQRINNILFDLEMGEISGAAVTQTLNEMPNVTKMPNDS